MAYVTHRGPYEPDPDIALALPAMRGVGLDVDVEVWDDPTVAWSDFDLVLVRSAWDYLDRRPEFLRWARAVEDVTRLANPARVLVRNSDKTYLRDLGTAGVPVIDTVWCEPGDEPARVAEDIRTRGWSRCVVKPNVAAGARGIIMADSAQEAVAAADALVRQGRSALIQPYLEVVESYAEVAVVLLGGKISHAVTRVPPLTAGGIGDAHGEVDVPQDLADFVLEAVAAFGPEDELLYARVDVVPTERGWLLMELEATEPCLFLEQVPRAAANLASAVHRCFE